MSSSLITFHFDSVSTVGSIISWWTSIWWFHKVNLRRYEWFKQMITAQNNNEIKWIWCFSLLNWRTPNDVCVCLSDGDCVSFNPMLCSSILCYLARFNVVFDSLWWTTLYAVRWIKRLTTQTHATSCNTHTHLMLITINLMVFFFFLPNPNITSH